LVITAEELSLSPDGELEINGKYEKAIKLKRYAVFPRHFPPFTHACGIVSPNIYTDAVP